MTSRPRLVSFSVVAGVALVLYLPFLTRNYDLNGLVEAAALRSGRPGDLFTPNHMLYRPIAFAVQSFLRALGWDAGIVGLLQTLSAIFGALGAGFAYLAFQRLTANSFIAAWTSLGLAVSWSYWTLSTDVYYYSLAAMLVAATLAVFVHADSIPMFALCGVLAGLSALACQANVFLLPGLTVATFLRAPAQSFRRAAGRVCAIGIAAAACVLSVFGAVGVWVYGKESPGALLDWMASYSGNALPMWGAWSLSRVAMVFASAFKSVVGMELWLFGFFHRLLPNGELPSWVPVMGFFLLAGLLIVAWRWGAGEEPWKPRNRNRTLLWLLLMYAAYIPFVIWWEAMEPRWFIMPNVMLGGLIAMIAVSLPARLSFRLAVPVAVLALGVMNFASSAAPRHFLPSVPIQTAACVASHMRENDLFLATEWNWAGYIDYVHGRQVMNFISEVSRTGDKRLALESVSNAVTEQQRQGGNVYMMDIRVYTPEYMKWLQDQTKLTAEDLSAYSGEPAFDCAYGSFFRLRSLTR